MFCGFLDGIPTLVIKVFLVVCELAFHQNGN